MDAVLPLVAKTCAFHEAANPVKYPFLPEPEKRYRRWLTERTADPRSVFLVACDGQRVVGFLVAETEPEIPIYRVSEYAFIHDMWVEEPYRRRGLARRMLQDAVARFQMIGVGQIRLDVLQENQPARRLFESCGFAASVVEMILPLGR